MFYAAIVQFYESASDERHADAAPKRVSKEIADLLKELKDVLREQIADARLHRVNTAALTKPAPQINEAMAAETSAGT